MPATGLWPSFSATPTTGASPLTVQFTDQTYTSDPGGVLAWQWDFDGDSIIDSSLQNPSFVYTGCGSFNVSLTAIDASHPPATLTRNNYINTDLLTPGFTMSLIAPPAVYQFTDTTTPTPQTWAWDFNGDSIIDSTVQNPVWAYTVDCSANVITQTVTRNCRTATSTRNFFVAPASLTAVPFTGGNGTTSATFVGNMFDISVTAPDGISICAITQGIYTYTGPFHVDIYVTPGSYVGKDATASAWRLVASGNGVSAGGALGAPSRNDVVLNNSFYLPAGNYGVVVFLSALPSGTMYVSYTNGPQGPFSNADLTINPFPATAGGVSKYTLFGTGTFSPRCWNGTFHYTKVSLTGTGGYGFFGEGCPSSLGVTSLTANSAPRLGQTLTVTGNRLPLNVAIGMLGLSNTTSTFGPLPVSLAPFGAPGCFGRVSLDAYSVLVGASNSASWSLSIPNVPSLLAVRAYQQMLVFEPSLNVLGAAASDAAGFVIGQ